MSTNSGQVDPTPNNDIPGGAPVVPPTPDPAPGQVPPAGEGTRTFSAEYVQELRDEAANRRKALKEAESAHSTEVSRLHAEMAETQSRLDAALALATDREKALTTEFERRLSTLPEEARALVRGDTIEARLEHLTEIQAATDKVFRPVLPNPSLPPAGGGDPGPASYAEWAKWPTAKADAWATANPARFKSLEDEHFGRRASA